MTGAIVATSDVFISCLYPLLDNRVFLCLERRGTRGRTLYGHQRLFGTIGQGAISALNGFLIKKIDYKIIFISLGICGTIFLLLVFFIIPSNEKEEESVITTINANGATASAPIPTSKNEENKENHHKELKFTTNLVFFLLCSLFAGVTRSILGSYLTSFFEHDLKLTPEAFGLAMIAMQTRIFSEVLIYFIGPFLSRSLGNHVIFLFGQILGVLRPVLYLLASRKSEKWPLIISLVELLKGAGNACLIASGVKIIYDLNPRLAYAQGLFSGIHINLATAISGIIGGVLLKSHDDNIRELFYISIILGTIGFVLHIISITTTK